MEKGARGAVMGKPTKPFWMRLHVAEFIADTANMTSTQGWAYIQLLLAMWRSDDGTLPHDADTLAHIGKVPRYRWKKVWAAIGRFFDVDGDRVTSAALQAELGKANALITMKRAAAQIGGKTTQYRRSSAQLMRTTTPPTPLKSNNGAQADAKHNYNYNIDKKEEGSALPPLPEGGASASPEKYSIQVSDAKVVRLPTSQPITQPGCPSAEQREAIREGLLNLKRSLNGGGGR
jgi:uncharacterized protein YdaU (DUF1376 family)